MSARLAFGSIWRRFCRIIRSSRRPGRNRRWGDQRGAVGQRVDPADLLGLCPDDGRGGYAPRDDDRGSRSELSGARLDRHFSVLYTGVDGFVAHECILDLRPITKKTGITADDVAKRLADYGLHAPTMSFPVAGTLMVEPTESEDLAELDRFCEAMIAIREEIDRLGRATGRRRTIRCGCPAHRPSRGEWAHPYSRQEAAYPRGLIGRRWPPVRRIDGARGDRNLVCSCPPLDAYQG